MGIPAGTKFEVYSYGTRKLRRKPPEPAAPASNRTVSRGFGLHPKEERMKKRILIACCACLFAVTLGATQAQKPLTNDDVVQMVKAGFDETTTIAAIDATDSNFDTSVQGMMALKGAGVSEKVIAAMLSATKRKAGAEERKAAEAKAAEAKAEAEAKAKAEAEAKAKEAEKNKDIPDDVGVYVKVKGALAEMYAEPVNSRSGGVGKSMLTMGFTKGHVNGAVTGPKSKLQVGTPVDIIIKCKEGETPSEYQLLKLDEKGDRREFRALTGGVYHASSGTDKNALAFEFEKIGSRTYRLKMPALKKGEYGILPPGGASVGGVGGGVSGQTMQGGSVNSGKLYTFGVIE